MTYDLQEKDKKRVQAEMLRQASGLELGTQDLAVNFIFEMPIPKSVSEVKRNLMNWDIIRPNIKPDLSNLIKFYEDTANKILFEDDRQITFLKATKRYSNNPKTIMEIMPKAKTLNEKAEGILGQVSPDELFDFLKTSYELIDLYDTDEEIDAEMQQELDGPVRELRLIRTAELLSYLADNFSKKFKKIASKYSGFWRDCEKARDE